MCSISKWRRIEWVGVLLGEEPLVYKKFRGFGLYGWNSDTMGSWLLALHSWLRIWFRYLVLVLVLVMVAAKSRCDVIPYHIISSFLDLGTGV